MAERDDADAGPVALHRFQVLIVDRDAPSRVVQAQVIEVADTAQALAWASGLVGSQRWGVSPLAVGDPGVELRGERTADGVRDGTFEWLSPTPPRGYRWQRGLLWACGLLLWLAATYFASINVALWIYLRGSASMEDLFRSMGGTLTPAPCDRCPYEFASASPGGLLIWALVVVSSTAVGLLLRRARVATPSAGSGPSGATRARERAPR